MEKLNFYTVDLDYVDLLKAAELSKRGFSRVPNMDYGNQRKPNFCAELFYRLKAQIIMCLLRHSSNRNRITF